MLTTEPPPLDGDDINASDFLTGNSDNLKATGTLESDFNIALQLQPTPPSSPLPQSPLNPSQNDTVPLNYSNNEVFRVYFKGMMNEERIGDSSSTITLAGIGVAICDSSDEVIYELRKPLGEDELSRRGVECKALIQGLNSAINLGLRKIVLYFDYYPLYQFVTGNWSSKQRNIASLLDQVASLTNKFTYCGASFIARNEIKFACKLAREAISSQVKRPENPIIFTGKETCGICFEDSNVDQIFSVNSCTHRYCFSCMSQHVEAKLFNGLLPKCPHQGCDSELKIDSCCVFLSTKLIEIMKAQEKESLVPLEERIYCPYPKCSALMSEREISKNESSGAHLCAKCLCEFCINCKVIWHANMTCAEYEEKNKDSRTEQTKLKSLAASNMWRQCEKCKHMIELAAGCRHVTCRCRYEFCYNCGAEWKDKKATCDCPLWDNEDDIYNRDEFEDQLYEYEYEYESEDGDEDEDGDVENGD